MVSSWENGGEYEIHLKVRQTASDPKSATFEVIEATDETQEESEEAPEEGAAPPTGKPMGKMAGKPAIMIAFGHHS